MKPSPALTDQDVAQSRRQWLEEWRERWDHARILEEPDPYRTGAETHRFRQRAMFIVAEIAAGRITDWPLR